VILDLVSLNDPKVEKKAAKDILRSGDQKSIGVLKQKLGKRTFLLYSSKYLQSAENRAAVPLNLTSVCEVGEFLLSHQSRPSEPHLADSLSKRVAFESSSTFAKERRKSVNWFEEGFECSVDNETIEECLPPGVCKREATLVQATALVEKTEMVG
jgi:hypothetical protein